MIINLSHIDRAFVRKYTWICMEKRRKKLKKSCHSYSICKIDREVKPDMYILRNSIQFESTMYLCNCVLQSMIELKCKCE